MKVAVDLESSKNIRTGQMDKNNVCNIPPPISVNAFALARQKIVSPDKSVADGCPLDVHTVSHLSFEDFVLRNLLPGKPVLIRGLDDSFPVMKSWCRESPENGFQIDWNSLEECAGDVEGYITTRSDYSSTEVRSFSEYR